MLDGVLQANSKKPLMFSGSHVKTHTHTRTRTKNNMSAWKMGLALEGPANDLFFTSNEKVPWYWGEIGIPGKGLLPFGGPFMLASGMVSRENSGRMSLTEGSGTCLTTTSFRV